MAQRDQVHLPYPWIDGLTRRQQEEIYMDFQALAGLGGTRWRTVVIAAADSHAAGRATADYRCPGVADQATIQRAIDDLAAHAAGATLGRIVLLEGTYNLSGKVTISALTSRSLAIEGMAGNIQNQGGVPGTKIVASTGTDPVFECNGVGGDPSGTVILENLAINGTTSNQIIQSRDLTLHVRQCRLVQAGSGGCIGQSNSTGGSSNTIIDGNFCVGGSGSTVIGVSSGPTLATVSYVRNNTVSSPGAGIGIATGNEISSTPTYHVSDNTITGGGTGTGINIGGTSTQNNVVCDNHLKNHLVGIRVAGYKNIVATNLLEDCDSGIIDGAFQLDASFIVGNNIIDSATLGIRVGNTSSTKNGILGNKVVGYAITVPIACQVGAAAVQTHVYYNDFDSGVTTPISDSGSGTNTQFGIPSGGTTGQLLAKASSASGDTVWQDDYVKAAITAAGDLIVGTGAGAFQALHKAGTLPMGPSWSQRILVDDTASPGVRWGPTVTVGTVAPTSPQAGDIWLDTT